MASLVSAVSGSSSSNSYTTTTAAAAAAATTARNRNNDMMENVVKERCANLILTGKRANQGNHKIWRGYAEGAARELKLSHIVNQIDRVKNSAADQNAPIDLFSSDEEEEGGNNNNLGGLFFMDGGSNNNIETTSSTTTLSLLTLAKDIDELHNIVRHVLCVYARDVAQGYSVDENGYKMFEKTEHAPELSEHEIIVQKSAVRVVAISLLGINKVGNWPMKSAPINNDNNAVDDQENGNRKRSNSSTTRAILPEFTCNVCKELMYEPVTTNCGHNFCRDCLVMWMEKRKKYSCPTCRNKVGHNWRMPINTVVWNAMLTMYPERLKKRKRDVELEISERPGKKKYRKIDPDETTECPNCDKQIKTNKLGLHLKLCTGAGGANSLSHEINTNSPSRGSRSATMKNKRSTRSGRVINSGSSSNRNAKNRKNNNKRKKVKRKKNNNNSNNNNGYQQHSNDADDNNNTNDQTSNTQYIMERNSSNKEQNDVNNNNNNNSNGNSSIMNYIVDSNNKQIGVMDSSATFHMKAGLDHLAIMEIRRLNLLKKSLSHFHPGVLSHMTRLHQAKIARGEVDANDPSLLPRLELHENTIEDDNVETTSWSMSNCILQ